MGASILIYMCANMYSTLYVLLARYINVIHFLLVLHFHSCIYNEICTFVDTSRVWIFDTNSVSVSIGYKHHARTLTLS